MSIAANTDPLLTLPFGLNATLDCDDRTFWMDEVATKPRHEGMPSHTSTRPSMTFGTRAQSDNW